MVPSAQPSLVGQMLRLLPSPLLRALDAWSHRVALRRAAARQEKWLQRKAMQSAAKSA